MLFLFYSNGNNICANNLKLLYYHKTYITKTLLICLTYSLNLPPSCRWTHLVALRLTLTHCLFKASLKRNFVLLWFSSPSPFANLTSSTLLIIYQILITQTDNLIGERKQIWHPSLPSLIKCKFLPNLREIYWNPTFSSSSSYIQTYLTICSIYSKCNKLNSLISAFIKILDSPSAILSNTRYPCNEFYPLLPWHQPATSPKGGCAC